MLRITAAILLSLYSSQAAVAQTRLVPDDVGDRAVRRTDAGADAPLNDDIATIPDLIEYQIGRWQPDDPAEGLYAGTWSNTGGFLRFDLTLDGLINPPGPLNLLSDTYDPFLYGPSPLIGFVEFNVDQNVNSGGELDFPEFRYLGNAGRFGGLIDDSILRTRQAVCGSEIDHTISTPPFVDRSGEEFHIAFAGDTISGVSTRLGDTDSDFEPGEAWTISANWLHRAHSFEPFSGAGNDGIYEPETEFIFRHFVADDRTIVTLVFPLTNLAAAAAAGEIEEPNNGSDADQASIHEALMNLTQSVTAIPVGDPARLNPEFQSIRPWENQSALSYLDPTTWEVNIIVGMAYETLDPFGALFAPTDIMPGPTVGDFDGNGVVNAADVQLFDTFLVDNDGIPSSDDDATPDGIITIPDFGPNFCMYDLDYDGVIDNQDRKRIVIMGDINLDTQVNVEDLSEFVTLLLNSATKPDPVSTAPSHQKFLRANFNGDGIINGKDIPGFIESVLAG